MNHSRQDDPQERGTGLPNLPGIDMITHASLRAGRRMSAVQRTPLGKRIANVVRNLLWVVPLTLLIWLYAERTSLEPVKSLAVPVTVRSDRPDRVVSLVTPADHTFFVELQGPRVRNEEARAELSNEQGITITLPPELPVGPQIPQPAMEYISNAAVFSNRGIVIKSVTPSTMTLQVDELVETEVRPEFPPAIAARLESVGFDPPTVKLRGPRNVLLSSSSPKVIADVSEQMLPTTAGEQDIPAIPLRLSQANEQITITPKAVKAKVKLRSSTTTYTISSVPVFVSGPVSLLDKYRVNFPSGPFIPRVTVVGPDEQIRKIDNREFVPKATLEIRQEDARERPIPRPPSYTLPENVRVIEEDAKRPIAFELIERTRPE